MSAPAAGVTAACGSQLGTPGTTEAELIAAAVSASPYVVGLHGGRFGEVATYLPGRRVTGVRLHPVEAATEGGPTPTVVEVHVTVRYATEIADIDASVRAAVHAALGPHRNPVSVSIVIGDIVTDRPVIGGPVGDRPVLDIPRSVPTPAPAASSEPGATTSGPTACGPVPVVVVVGSSAADPALARSVAATVVDEAARPDGTAVPGPGVSGEGRSTSEQEDRP